MSGASDGMWGERVPLVALTNRRFEVKIGRMAFLTSAPHAGASYCVYHHQPAVLCDSPELADCLDTLRALDIDPTLVSEHAFTLDVCGACPDDEGIREPFAAVVRINYTAGSNGRRYHEDACPLHVREVVGWWRRFGRQVSADIPVPAGVWGSIVPGGAA